MSRHKPQTWSQVAHVLTGCLLAKRKEEREEKTQMPHGAQEKVNRKAPLLPLATDPEDSNRRDLGGGLGPPGGLAALLLAGDRIPRGAAPRLGMASVYTKYLSSKGTGGGEQ